MVVLRLLVQISLQSIIGLLVSGVPSFEHHPLGALEKASNQDVCDTPECQEISEVILNAMNQTVDPCDSFYEFTCGQYSLITNVSKDKPREDRETEALSAIAKKIKTILEESSINDTKPMKLVKDLYNACMDENKIDKEGIEAMKSIIDNLGGWPILEGKKWNESGFTWNNTIGLFRKNGFFTNYLLDVDIIANKDNTTQMQIMLDTTETILRKRHFDEGLDSPTVQAYYNYSVEIAKIFGASEQSAKEEMLEVLHFEQELANLIRDDESCTMEEKELVDLQKEYPLTNWKEYINTAISPHSEIADNDKIILAAPCFVGNLSSVLEKYSKRTQANYMVWQAIDDSIRYLPKRVRDVAYKFYNDFNGYYDFSKRYEQCFEDLYRTLPTALSAVYVQKYFADGKEKAIVTQMYKNVESKIIQGLEAAEWIDVETKEKAVEKIKNIFVVYGYPDELLDLDKISKVYENYDIQPASYIEMVLSIMKHNYDNWYSILHQNIPRSDWRRYAYDPEGLVIARLWINSIDITAGTFEGVSFSPKRPSYVNYGAMGTDIGTAILFFINEWGRNYDSDGNSADWWSKEAETAYDHWAQCFVDQYDDFLKNEFDEKESEGVTARGTLVAKHGGILSAYAAYKESLQKEKELQLPNLPYTPEQMFWISFGTFYCSNEIPSYLNYQLSGPYPVNKFNVDGILQNLDPFVQDFNCPLGSPMNTKQKCKL